MNDNTRIWLSFGLFWVVVYTILNLNYPMITFILYSNPMIVNIAILYFGINIGIMIERVKNKEKHTMLEWIILFLTVTAVFIVANIYSLLIKETGGFDEV